MGAVLLLAAGAGQTALLYALIGAGFFFASTAARHFCFAAASAFVLAPYLALLIGAGPLGAFVALLACGTSGLLYWRAAEFLSRRGAREGQLLIASIAVMIIVESGLSLGFGSASITLQDQGLNSASDSSSLSLLLAGLLLIVTLAIWRGAVVGKLARALLDSRLNLALRGVPVGLVEAGLAAVGFALLGASGLLWAFDGRVKPSMPFEVGLTGAVALIVGRMFGARLIAVVCAAIGLALVRQGLSLVSEGDWSMAAVAVLLVVALALRQGRSRLQIS